MVVLSAIIITCILPSVYASSAMVRWPGLSIPKEALANGELEVINSEAILGKVVDHLDLNITWGKKFGLPVPLTTAESIAFLRKQIEVSPVRNTILIRIRAYNENSREAAAIANEIAKVYVDHVTLENKDHPFPEPPARPSTVQDSGIFITDRAEPAAKPVLPNHFRNIAAGALIGLLLGTIVAALVILLGFLFPNIHSQTPGRN